MSIVAVILAADHGQGFPTPKYLSPVRGSTLLDAVVADATSWPVDEVMVVLGADAQEVEAGADLKGVSVLVDPEWAEGAASPIRASLDLLSRDRGVSHVLLARGDQPGIGAGVVDRVVAAARSEGVDAVVPKYRYALGWPVAVARSLWDVFLGLEGAIDVHDLIATHASSTHEVWFDHLSPAVINGVDDLPRARR
jgi:molybdenum cofactor cytidylyltransferase